MNADPSILRLPLDQLPDPLPIPRLDRPFDVAIRPPGSKSITNRALLLAALADGTSTLRNALVDADDAEVMIAAIEQLGAGVKRFPTKGELRINGVGGRWKIPAGQTITLNLHNAGTATRFLAAAAILAPPGTSIVIDGDKRMRERPIGDLAGALTQLGARVEYLGAPDCPPLRITPPADLKTAPHSVSFDQPKSSQFISAIMLIAPWLPRPTTIDIRGGLPSEPYIAMSQALLGQLLARQRGPKFVGNAKGGVIRFCAPSFPLKGFELDIEPDASGATYFAAAAMLTPRSRIVLTGLPTDKDASMQGDVAFFDVIRAFGGSVDSVKEGTVVRSPSVGIQPIVGDWDFSPIPDTAMTAAVLACYAVPPRGESPGAATSTFHGLGTLRIKETDRLAALKTELSRIGAKVEIIKDPYLASHEGLRITPPLRHSVTSSLSSPTTVFHTYNDHRMAMSLALIGLRGRPDGREGGIAIADPKCVAKTYPTFWQDLARLYTGSQ